MKETGKGSLPISFNPLKHHGGYISDYIQKKPDESTLRKDLLKIGNSQMDLYLGDLSVDDIEKEVFDRLKGSRVVDRITYHRFIRDNDGFVKIQLSDRSFWILRMGEDDQHHIHIHPARNCPKTVRVRASTLKTAIAILVEGGGQMDLAGINRIRNKVLRLSPVKTFNKSSGLSKVVEALSTISWK